jgi:hypothetical protein
MGRAIAHATIITTRDAAKDTANGMVNATTKNTAKSTAKGRAIRDAGSATASESF